MMTLFPQSLHDHPMEQPESSAERLALLLSAPQPLRLVRSLPDFELYLTVRELGPQAALPLIALASAEQLRHLIDLESWRRDRFDGVRAGAWVALLLEAGEPALRRFLRTVDDDQLALLAQRWMRLSPIEPEVQGQGYERDRVTPDGSCLFLPSIPKHVPAIRRLLALFAGEEPRRYRQMLWSAVVELPAELEERALHWRQSRLEEHGFPPWQEAIGVYGPPTGALASPFPLLDPQPVSPRGLLRLLPDDDLLSTMIERLPAPLQDRVLHETLAVANRLLVADGADTGDPAAHREALRNAAGYAGVALAVRGAAGVQDTPLIELFREGYALAVELQERARALVRDGWLSADPRALELLEPPDAESIRGLLAPRPLYGGRGVSPRPFRSLAEIEDVRAVLETAEVIGRLWVDRLGLDVAQVIRDSDPPRLSALMLTRQAWHATRSELRGDPLPAEVVADFLRSVASRRTAGGDAPERTMDGLTDRMIRAFALEAREAALLRAFGRGCLSRLREECAALDPGVPLDPRHVSCLLLKTEEP